MGSCSARKKARTLKGQVLQLDYFDFKDDSRLNRRLRRKLNVSAAKENSKQKFSCNAPERRVKNKIQVQEIISVDDDENDSDYDAYLMEGVQTCTDATSGEEVGDDGGDSNEYDSDYVNYITYLMEGEKSCTDARFVDEVGDDDHGCNSSHEECLKNLCGDGKSQTDVHDDEDPDYKVFLEIVKKDGNSYVLKVFVGSEMLDPIMYEKDYRTQDVPNLETETLKSCSMNEKTKVKRTLRGISNRENMRIKNSIDDRESPRTLKESLEISNGVVGKRRKGSVVKKNANMKCPGPVSGRMQGFSNMRSGSESSPSAKDDCDDNAESDGERSYLKYLNGHTIDCKAVVSVGQSDNPLRIDEDGKSDSDLEVIAMDKDPYCNGGYTPFVIARPCHERIEADNWMCNGSIAASHSQFREKLMEILKRPYDSNEYNNLFKEVSCRKPIVRDRTLRSVTKTYKSDSIAQSYLDWCTELAEKIDLARDDRLRTLNLLRGFFYWLQFKPGEISVVYNWCKSGQNLSQEEAFRPWLDPICSEVLPPLESPVDDNATTESDE